MEFELDNAYLAVARTPASQTRRRIEILREAKIASLTQACAGTSTKHVFAAVSGLSMVAQGDIVESATTLDATQIADARASGTLIAATCEFMIAGLDLNGSRVPSKQEIRQMAGIAEDAVHLSRLIAGRWGRRRNITDLQARVKGRRLFVNFTNVDTFDAASYERALAESWLNPRLVETSLNPDLRTDTCVIREALRAIDGEIIELPGELAAADTALEKSTGASLLDLLRVAEGLRQHPVEVVAVYRRSPQDFTAEIAERVGLTTHRANAALELFITDLDDIHARVSQPDFEPDAANLIRWRPLLRTSERRILYSPFSFTKTLQHSYIKAALSGSWPTNPPPGGESSLFNSYLRTRRSKARPIQDFERQVRETVASVRIGNSAAYNVSPERSQGLLGVHLRGEVDAIAADIVNSIIWVISAKDSAQVLEAAQVKNQLKDFYGGDRSRIGAKSHVAVLQSRIDEVLTAPSRVVYGLGIDDGQRHDWEVRGLFVTRIPSPAAADSRRVFPFVMIGQLATYLEQPPRVAPERSCVRFQ